jgi:hypothetical protein
MHLCGCKLLNTNIWVYAVQPGAIGKRVTTAEQCGDNAPAAMSSSFSLRSHARLSKPCNTRIQKHILSHRQP